MSGVEAVKESVRQKIERHGLTIIPVEKDWAVCRLCNIEIQSATMNADISNLLIGQNLELLIDTWIEEHSR